jgi:hypothetical protein
MTDTRHTPTTAPGRGSTAGRAPVAPGRLPVLGHALQLSRGPIAFLESLRGIAPVVRVDLGGWPLHVLTEPALIHTVLVGEAHKFGRGPSSATASPPPTAPSTASSAASCSRRSSATASPATPN